MPTCIPGQRWINASELQLGLGTVLAADQRTVTLAFAASGETRTYALQSAPLSRVHFQAGDRILSQQDQALLVQSVEEQEGLLVYLGVDENGSPARLHEAELNHFMQLNQAGERLFSGQIDRPNWFEFRQQTLSQQKRLSQSPLYGLLGCRTSLIPHQLYIAHEVSRRFAPRVLLADEVGLGKTIEAGLILHRQLLRGLAGRVLIVVPDNLVHQWLVEMLRRFNLGFSIFDLARCQAAEAGSSEGNPFHTEQLVLCSLGFLVEHPRHFQQALQGEWDLLVVDEAHHLRWTEQHASPEYRLIEQLVDQTPGTLLLTATPEQLGHAGHFARLRLLDPDRFTSLEEFVREEQAYAPVADAMQVLLAEGELAALDKSVLADLLGESDNRQLLADLEAANNEQAAEIRGRLVDHILDRHGTGRVLFRNTRSAMQGFPERRLQAYPLMLPAAYQDSGAAELSLDAALQPERQYVAGNGQGAAGWTARDPRIQWLLAKLPQLRDDKVLLIAARADTVLDIARYLKEQLGIHAAVFHEGMSLVQRDRAAAHFAAREDGSQILLCSEIGSEGRNFQFSHHLVLFDLPLNPDLLEQRIGRLDRIGQTHTIHIHVPYLQGTAQEVLFYWYHQGLNAFERTCPAGTAVFEQLQRPLLDALRSPRQDWRLLVQQAAELTTEKLSAMHQGRDRLLEYNSCRPGAAESLLEEAQRFDQASRLPAYLELACDCLDIRHELLQGGGHLLSPGDHMLYALPGLPEDGLRFSFDRSAALAKEDLHFMTWEHPLVVDLMDSVLSSENGNTAVITLPDRRLAPGSVLLECLFRLDTSAERRLQVERYLPPTAIRVLLDESGRDQAPLLSAALIRERYAAVDLELARQAVKMKQAVLRSMLEQAERQALGHVEDAVRQARGESQYMLGEEINRLRALRTLNPNIRDEEIDYFEAVNHALDAALGAAHLRQDALRVIIITE